MEKGTGQEHGGTAAARGAGAALHLVMGREEPQQQLEAAGCKEQQQQPEAAGAVVAGTGTAEAAAAGAAA